MKAAIGIGIALAAAAWAQQSMVDKAVDPEWGFDLAQPHVVEPVWIDATVSEKGELLAISAETGLPDALVQALRKSTYQKRGSPYIAGWTVEVHRPLAGYRVRGTIFKGDATEARRQVTKLDLAKALAMESKLPSTLASVLSRTVLLVWAASNPGPEADAIRFRQIAWLVENAPQTVVLREGVSRINAQAGPGANAEAYRKVRDLWLKAINGQAATPGIFEAVGRFLLVSDPALAEQILRPMESRIYTATPNLGVLYAFAGIGVTGIDTPSGAVMVAEDALPQTPFAEHARAALETSTDPRLLRAGMDALESAAWTLGVAGELPAGFAAFCEAVRRQAISIVPDESMTCREAVKDEKRKVVAAEIKSQAKPSYPGNARSVGLEGQVIFIAVMGKDGKIKEMELAVARWSSPMRRVVHSRSGDTRRPWWMANLSRCRRIWR